jgi:hypothetical protein
LYWIEASAGADFIGATWGLVGGYGTYSLRSQKDAATVIAISAKKSLSDAVSVIYNYSLGIDENLSDAAWIGIGYSF